MQQHWPEKDVGKLKPRTVVLPRACDVFDLFDGSKPVAIAAREFTVTVGRNQTKLFRLSESKTPRTTKGRPRNDFQTSEVSQTSEVFPAKAKSRSNSSAAPNLDFTPSWGRLLTCPRRESIVLSRGMVSNAG